MDELDRTEEMPRNEVHDPSIPPLALARAPRGTQRRLSLPPPLPPRARRWTPTPADDNRDDPPVSTRFPIRRAVSLRVPIAVPEVIEPVPAAPPAATRTAAGPEPVIEPDRPPMPAAATPARRSASMPPIPEAALRRALPAEASPSLTEELQLLAAETDASDPTEYYARPSARPRRRARLIGGGAVVLAIAILAILLRTPASTPDTTVDVAITSSPAGASVTLIDEEGATVIGKTPATASLDKAHGYDLVFSLRGHQTTIYHLAPSSRAPVTVELRRVEPGESR